VLLLLCVVRKEEEEEGDGIAFFFFFVPWSLLQQAPSSGALELLRNLRFFHAASSELRSLLLGACISSELSFLSG